MRIEAGKPSRAVQGLRLDRPRPDRLCRTFGTVEAGRRIAADLSSSQWLWHPASQLGSHDKGGMR